MWEVGDRRVLQLTVSRGSCRAVNYHFGRVSHAKTPRRSDNLIIPPGSQNHDR